MYYVLAFVLYRSIIVSLFMSVRIFVLVLECSGIGNLTRSVTCPNVVGENVNIYLFRWSAEREVFEVTDRQLDKKCSDSPFLFFNLIDSFHAHVIEGSITKIIYSQDVDSLADEGEQMHLPNSSSLQAVNSCLGGGTDKAVQRCSKN